MSTARRRLLVTGAGGFLGRHVVAVAIERYDVVALTATRPLPDELAAQCARVVQGDVRDDEAIADALGGVDAVCHLAAHVPTNHEDPAEAEPCVQVNALATLRLANAALARGVRRFVYAAAGTVYAPVPRPATEDDPAAPVARATYYLASKLLGEHYLEHLRIGAGLEALSLRISSIYGAGMPASSLVARFAALAAAGAPLEVLHGGIPEADLVSADDVARGLVAAVEHGPAGVYNIGGGRAWSLREVAEVVVDVFDSRSEIVVQPPRGPVPASFATLDIAKARATWRYEPAALPEGVRRVREAMQAAS